VFEQDDRKVVVSEKRVSIPNRAMVHANIHHSLLKELKRKAEDWDEAQRLTKKTKTPSTGSSQHPSDLVTPSYLLTIYYRCIGRNI
jgi:hypothetical protein